MSLLQRPALRRLQVRPGVPLPVARAGAPPSSRRHFSVAESWTALSTSTAETIVQVHQAGLPWWLTIPLVAATINFSIRLPMQAYSRTLQNRRHKVQPFLDAWAYRHSREVDAPGAPPPVKGDAAHVEKMKRLTKTRVRLYKNYRCENWKSFLPLAGSVPFITMTDALRRLASPDLAPPDIGLKPQGGTDPSTLIDPSIAEGGLAWFTNLTAADPYLILPVTCSVILGASVYRGMDRKTVLDMLTGRNRPVRGTGQTGWEMVRRTLLWLPLFPLALYQAPAAMFLYWFTTFSLTHLNNAIIGRWRPPPTRTLHTPTGVRHVRPWLHSSVMDKPRSDRAAPKAEAA
ncbi:Mitochondrial inner membrane protein-like protein [Hapsidospora chrysogenum ATCC 11550]|uniref:Mitochondrial inner membrane protein-like protein n=1 Tax=Hapsidospora chrysogenum (strain ATCC 11550 / CBS 779.69 / DSM 880 / IAM 14645 / JCM 23072 / IMI 49137) TaxID=857340 RepID=A0A086T250_HAPC1|nr:Mitochondrial inner membrane protein-like protein [Hapsidospora chrysogenum ATCC 11550]